MLLPEGLDGDLNWYFNFLKPFLGGKLICASENFQDKNSLLWSC